MQEVPTHVAPPHDMSKVIMLTMILMILLNVLPSTKCNVHQDAYVALNKPTSVDHWLKNAKVSGTSLHICARKSLTLLHRVLGTLWSC